MLKSKPDLEFERDYDCIRFFLDDDHLEIYCVNSDSDTFIIILNPSEIVELKNLLEKVSNVKA